MTIARIALAAAALLAAQPLAAQSATIRSKPPLPSDMTPTEQTAIRDFLRTYGLPIGDVNKDGRLTKAELTAYGMSQGWGNVVLSKKWKEIDVDRNGWASATVFGDYTIREMNAKRARAALGTRR